jgi:hypothetical protein
MDEDHGHLDEPRRHGDLWFDPFLESRPNTGLSKLVNSGKAFLEFYEKRFQPRTRARKPEDAIRWWIAAEIVVANLVYASLHPSTTEDGEINYFIAVSRTKNKKKSRYDNQNLSPKVLNRILDALADSHIMTMDKGKKGKGYTRIAPSSMFVERVNAEEVKLSDFRRSANEELVVLSHKDSFYLYGNKITDRDLLEYQDTDKTYHFRAELRELNLYLEQADIDFIDDGIEPKVDPGKRALIRNFSLLHHDHSHTFDKGGRLARGFWMNLPKSRRANLRIQGEPVAVLDFDNMYARLAYAKVGQQAPVDQDLYDLTGFLDGYEPKLRKTIKKICSSFLFGAKGTRHIEGTKNMLPEDMKVSAIREAFKKKHPPLKKLLGSYVGYGLMYQESEMLIEILKQLRDMHVVALPLHDAVIVAASKAEKAFQVMTDVAKLRIGQEMPVSSSLVI